MLIPKKDQKTLAVLTCYFSDVALLSWIYFKATNYEDYAKKAKVALDSPDFQIQLYRVLVQSLTFALLLFVLAQTIVYILYWRNLRSAQLYLKYFAIVAAAACTVIAFESTAFALLPFVIYCFGYYVFAGSIKPLALPEAVEEKQTPPQ
jgi:hypothetical protein